MNIEQARFELMARAPAVPDWFEPDMGDYGISRNPPSSDELSPKLCRAYRKDLCKYLGLEQKYEKETESQWPSYYADEVLKRGNK